MGPRDRGFETKNPGRLVVFAVLEMPDDSLQIVNKSEAASFPQSNNEESQQSRKKTDNTHKSHPRTKISYGAVMQSNDILYNLKTGEIQRYPKNKSYICLHTLQQAVSMNTTPFTLN